MDTARNRLIVGGTSKTTFPIKEGAVLFYDLGSFNPGNPADMDQHRTLHSPAASMRATYPNVYGLALSPGGDLLYVADPDNGLYKYSFSQAAYIGFYPAQRGTTSQAFEPQMVRSPRGVMPLHTPIAVALSPSGKVMVQQHVTGRVSILIEASWPGRVYLPLVIR